MYTSAQTGNDPVKLQSSEGQQQTFLFTLCGFDLSTSWLDWQKKVTVLFLKFTGINLSQPSRFFLFFF